MLNQGDSVPLWTKRTGTYLGAIAFALTALLLPGCTTDNEEIQEGKTNVTTEDVAENTEDIIGKEVTIRNIVEQKVGDFGYLVQAEEFGSEPILILDLTEAPFELPEEQEMPIQVTGEVAQLVIADIETEYGVELGDEYVEYEDQPVIIAESLALAPTPQDLAEAPTGYFDKVIAVEGDVRDIYSPSSISLFEDGWIDDIGVLVIGVNRNLKAEDSVVQDGERVTVTGVARQFDPKLLQDSDLGWDAEKIKEFGSRYTDRPVIVAEDIFPSAVDNK
ncbi:MAG: hypothetical protein RID53_31260 [Coleofasciculus sp. B1-GNL1-01]|uniref:hypothetical protein n=1 Tax=Coleofasciculus sp. B1-GNL1-01 TaxID=3068484 RepID=UPI0032F1C3AF